MRPSVYTRQARARVHVFDATPMPWEDTARPGLTMKTIRIDDDRGEFLGLIRFDRFVRSGVHGVVGRHPGRGGRGLGSGRS